MIHVYSMVNGRIKRTTKNYSRNNLFDYPEFISRIPNKYKSQGKSKRGKTSLSKYERDTALTCFCDSPLKVSQYSQGINDFKSSVIQKVLSYLGTFIK